MRQRLTWIATIAISLLPAALAAACPMCKDSIPNSDAQQASGLPGGFNFSVYYMLIGLFATMGMLGMVIVKGIRSADVQTRGAQNERGTMNAE